MTSLVGVIDGFNGRGVFGWVRDDGGESPCHIDIRLDGVLVATDVVADRFRKDLISKGDASGRHGFVSELPVYATFGDRVKVRITVSGTNEVIAEREFQAPYGGDSWRGVVRDPKNRTLSGWVKAYGSNEPVIADVYLDQHLVKAGIVCDTMVPELADEGTGAGGWGFDVAVEGFRAASDVVVVSLRDPSTGQMMISREVNTAALKDSFRGRLEISDEAVIRGWAINDNGPGDTFDVQVLLDGHPFLTTTNTLPRGDLRKAGLSLGRGGLRFDNPLHSWLIDGTDHTIALKFPDQTISDDFVFTSPPRRSQGGNIHGTQSRGGVTIIVPIYNAPDDVAVCIERLLEYTPDFARILLIDDCSPDPRVSDILDQHRGADRIEVLTNSENLGFTRTVNRGIALAGDDDVVLLNSDARVTPGWLEGMLEAAASSPRIATVTAMSDRAGAFSAPAIGNDNPLPDGVDEIAYARAFRRRSVGVYPRVPTGNGFCMWISRLCIEEIGPLDEEAFPRGYGEENDFCMRGGRAGWIHVIDDRTYVFHDRSKSFGESKADLMAAGRAVVDSRYPEYKRAISVFRDSPEIALARNRAYLAQADTVKDPVVLPRVLYVISTTTGGTPQTNADLMNALGDAVEPWVLRCDSRVITLSRMVDGVLREVCNHELRDRLEPIRHFSPEYDGVVASWLRQYDFDVVHVRHLLWHSLSLPNIAKQLGAKVVVSFHDYYALSPNLKLIDDRGTYLGDEFIESGSVYRDRGWPERSHPLPSGDWLQWWQERFWSAISMSDAFVTTSVSARALIISRFPEMDPERFKVIEHGRDFDSFRHVAARPLYGEPIRILVPGGISAAKGAEILREIADADTLGQVEWHILGPIAEKFDSEGSRIVYHGPYKRENFGDLVEKIAPHAGVVLSIWDETYCHTLTEMWSVGLPVFVLDFPNVAQRVRRFSAGWVLNGLEGGALLSQVTESLYDRRTRLDALRGVSDWQHGWGMAWTTKQMALRYLDIYRRLVSETPADGADILRVGVLARASRDLKLAPASTFIRVWERTRNAVDRSVDYIRVTPDGAIAAVHQGLLDALVVQPTAVPAAAVAELVDALDTTGVPLIVELDEDLAATHSGSEVHRGSIANAQTLGALLRGSTAISTSTRALQERVASYPALTEVFAAALSDRLWGAHPHPRESDGKVRALYFGSRTHSGDLEAVLASLDAVAAARPEFELVLIGVASSDQQATWQRDRPWMSSIDVPDDAKQYPQFVQWLQEHSKHTDFAIAPLAETDLNAQRSDRKLLEYLGLGLRTVASAVGPYRDTSVPGVVAVANSTEAWVSAVHRTIADVRTEGSRIDGLAWLRENRMLRQQAPMFDQFVRSAVGAAHSAETEKVQEMA